MIRWVIFAACAAAVAVAAGGESDAASAPLGPPLRDVSGLSPAAASPFAPHKGLVPIDLKDCIGAALTLVGAAFANAGGAGGGGIFVPMLILVMGFNAHEAIPLSKAMIFGGALAFLALSVGKRHPSARRPLIAYDIALMFEPMVLCGTTAGVLLNRTLPAWLILFMLELLLAHAVVKTLKKGVAHFRAETRQQSEGRRGGRTSTDIELARIATEEPVDLHRQPVDGDSEGGSSGADRRDEA
jgi:hypothetical protein